MPRDVSRSDAPLDVLVLGEHPAAYLAAILLKQKDVRVLHAALPGDAPPDRLVYINPHFFELDKCLDSLRGKLDLTPIYGLHFLSDNPAARSEHRSKSIIGHVALYTDLRKAIAKLAEDQGVESLSPKTLQIHHLDETGVDVAAGKTALRPRMLIVAGQLAEGQRRLIGSPELWGKGVLHRYAFVRLKGARRAPADSHPMLPMSLDLAGRLSWAWMLPHETKAGLQWQLAVEQPLPDVDDASPLRMLQAWANVLHEGQLLKDATFSPDAVESIDLPLAGALVQEGVANRTLLIGPAGGFFSACSEDIYPNCWSAVYAADIARKALKEPHLQDALQPFRHKWRTTLGDYLRGPQQNLRFLLPLVYRNQVMTSRLAESILLGKSVVQ